MDKKEDREFAVQPHVIYGDLSSEQVENLKSDENIEDIVRYKQGSSMVSRFKASHCQLSEYRAVIVFQHFNHSFLSFVIFVKNRKTLNLKNRKSSGF